MLVFLASCEPAEQDVKDDIDVGAEEDVEDIVDDVMSALRRRPVSRSSSTTKRSRAELVTHQDFQPALVAADDGWFQHVVCFTCTFEGLNSCDAFACNCLLIDCC